MNIDGFNFFALDKLDMLDGAAASRLCSRPAWICPAGRAGRNGPMLEHFTLEIVHIHNF
jgi:hypothetical protein